MFIDRRVCTLVAALLPGIVAASAQQASPAGKPPSRSILLDVVVAAKSGPPVAGLEQRDFTLVDNKSPLPITSFNAVSMGQDPVEVILLLDTVNTEFNNVASERGKVQDFLRANGGRLAYPTTFAVLTDQGTQVQKILSTDGNKLSDALGQYQIGLQAITRATQFSADDRLEMSLTALTQLADYAATLPGRKIILWISPGWPMESPVMPPVESGMMGKNGYTRSSSNGSSSATGVPLDSQQHRQIFDYIVSFSTQLRQAHVTLYNLDPLGAEQTRASAEDYRSFVKGVSKPSQTEYGNLGLQVLAIQSGGLALEANNDVAGMIRRCFADMASWYEITFDAPVPEQPNEYHHVQVKLDKPGLTARTRDGYYAQP